MKAVTKTLCLCSCLLLTLASASPSAGGWFSRLEDCAPGTLHARHEYEAEHRRSKHLAQLDCAGLTAHAEASRMASNRQFSAVYNRPLGPNQAAPAAVAPMATPRPTRPGAH